MSPRAEHAPARPRVTLQISLAPSDYAHARLLLPHQVRTWQNQVDEILLTVDLHRSRGRFSARWAEGREVIIPLAKSIPGARVMEVDYSPATTARIAGRFFNRKTIPAKDFRGGPFYTYFFGLDAATHDMVLHTDSDMFFGGGSRKWIDEALERLQQRPDILVTAPLPGPPANDGILRQLRGRRTGTELAYDFPEMSTRLFLIDRRRIESAEARLRLRCPPLRQTILAWFEGNPAADLPEHLITRWMAERNLVRHEFLGATPGMWSLHPPYRTAGFFDRLPELLANVESGNVPHGQLGDHDMNDSMVDWEEARQQLRRNRWWRRAFQRLTS